MSREEEFREWWNSLDDDYFQGLIDGLDPHEAAETFATLAHAAALDHAVEVLERMEDEHDLFTTDSYDAGHVDGYSSALREAAAKLKEEG